MKAIETIYRGFRFRSCNEARWATYLDAIGTPWQYESEGYEVGGIRYLPDFYLPELDLFLEVKSALPEREGPEFAKAVGLARASGKPVLFSVGDPVDGLEALVCYESDVFDQGNLGRWASYRATLAHCPACQRVVFAEWTKTKFGTPAYCQHLNEASRLPVSCEAVCRNAALLARQARFEHGETPTGTRLPATPRFYRPGMGVSVYLAGKIPTGSWGCQRSKPGGGRCRCKDPRQCNGYSWRDEIFTNWEQIDEPFRADSGLKQDGYLYAGPSFEGSGHGCYDHETVSRCFEELYGADVIFAWMHRPDVHGTMAELGYARAYNKRVYVGFDVSRYRALPETLRFARDIANEWIACTDPRTAWLAFERWYKG